jgi:protein tyrosine phosphatase
MSIFFLFFNTQHLNIKAKSTAGSQKVGKSAENRNYNRYRDVVPCTYWAITCWFLFQNLQLRFSFLLNYESKRFAVKITLYFIFFAFVLVFLWPGYEIFVFYVFLTDDHSLVRLRNSDTEYINANFVKVCAVKSTLKWTYNRAKLQYQDDLSSKWP